MRQSIHTAAAPQAIGAYSQAMRVGNTVYLSGQSGLHPVSGQLVDGLDPQIEQVLRNLQAVAAAADGTLQHAVKVTVLRTEMGHFAKVDGVMARHFSAPSPARAAVGVAFLPHNALIEIEATLVFDA